MVFSINLFGIIENLGKKIKVEGQFLDFTTSFPQLHKINDKKILTIDHDA